MPKEDQRIVDIDAYPWDAWFGLRANGTIVRWSSFGYSEFEASEEGDEPCITSIDANGTLAGTSYEGSATMIDYVILAYEGLEFPFTFELPERRNVVAVSATANFVMLDDRSTAWVYWQDRAPDGTTGHQRLELVSLPEPIVQVAGDDGLCFLDASRRVHCVDPRMREETKYGLSSGLAPEAGDDRALDPRDCLVTLSAYLMLRAQ